MTDQTTGNTTEPQTSIPAPAGQQEPIQAPQLEVGNGAGNLQVPNPNGVIGQDTYEYGDENADDPLPDTTPITI